MKTHFSNPEVARHRAMLHEQELNLLPPAIPLIKSKSQKEPKGDGDSSHKYMKVEVPLDKNMPDDKKTEWKIPTFESGDAESWAKWRIQYNTLVEPTRLIPLKNR